MRAQLLKREYIYNRTVPVMREDGTTVQKSVKLKTPHQETHAVRSRGNPSGEDRVLTDACFLCRS